MKKLSFYLALLFMTTFTYAETLSLSSGWTLVGANSSLSITQLKTKIGSDNLLVIQGQDKTYQKVYVDSGKNFLNDFSAFEVGKGYWVKVASAIDIAYDKITYSTEQNINLLNGWNLINPPTDLTISEISTQLGSNLEVIQGMNKTYQKVYIENGQEDLNNFQNFEEPQGYWVYVTTDVSLVFPIIVLPDTTKPVITLLGNIIDTIIVNTTYTDAGATALDDKDGDITNNIVVTSEVNSSLVGIYTVRYDVNDSANNVATTVIRTVHVNNLETTLTDLDLTVVVKGNISEQDNGNSDVIHPIVENPEHGTAEHYLVGNEVPYVRYTSTTCFTGLDTFIYRNGDEYGKVNVTIAAPTLEESPDYSETLLNSETIEGEELLYATPQVEITTAPTHGTATLDNTNGEITYYNYDPDDTYSGEDFFIYTITETINGCTHTSTGRVDFTVESSDTNKPIITLIGNSIEEIMLDSTYGDAGATAFDNEDGDITSSIITNNEVDSSTVGTYTVSYNVTDSQGNIATTVTRTVHVSSTANIKLISLCQDPYLIGSELYKTDGTLAGTSLVKDIYTATIVGTNRASSSAIYMPLNSKIGDIQYLSARDHRHTEFWMSDGTDIGTIIHEINPNNAFTADNIYGNSNPRYHTAIGNKLFFTASDKNVSRYGLYKAEGTTVTRISDTSGYKYSEINASLYYMTERDNTLFIEKTNSDFSGVEVVDSFTNYDSGDLYNLYAKLVAIDDTLFFVMRDKSNMGEGLQLWSKKGDAPAIRVSSSYMVDNYNQDLVKIGDKVYVIVNEIGIGQGRRLLESDGTIAGTELIQTLPEGESMSSLMTINNKLYFIHISGDDSFNTYYTLHSYTPESETFALVKDIVMNDYGDASVSTMHKMYTFENRIIFETLHLNDDNDHFEQLWVSDGTTEGTLPILRRDYQATSLRVPFKLNGEYFFQDSMDVLYKTDFTMAGTEVIIPYSCDITPISFSFTDVTDVELNEIQEAEITVEGISYAQTKVSIVNGEYSLDNRQSWISTDSTVANGQQIYVRHVSSVDYDSTVDTVLHVGERSDTFSSTTKEEVLATPDTFIFTDRTAVVLSAVQSDTITISGINQEVNLSIIDGEYSLDNGTTWSDVNVTVENNQVVTIRHTSSSSYETAVSTTLTVGGVSDIFTSTTRVEDVDNGDTVVVGDLMWEDTPHVPSVEANWVNYTEAVAYCSTLELKGFSDWRLPHAVWGDNGYNRENNEFLSIRQQPLDLEGEVWFYQYDNGDNYDQIDENSRSIIEPFTYIDQGGAGYWTDDQAGMTTGHMNVIFSGGLYNMDGWNDEWNSSVRCVRTLQTDDTPLVVEASADQSVEVNHAITITGSATSSVAISSYEWKYGNNVVGTTASFDYTPTSVNNQILVLKVVDANGNVASDVIHLKVEEANIAPTVDAGGDKTVQLGQSITITGSANDDSAIVGYEWKEGETSLANTVSFTYTPSSGGTKTLTLTVTDDDGATASDSMEVTVTEAPDNVPEAFTFTDVTDVERWSVQQANITVSDINTPATVSISGAGQYSLDDGTTWTTDEGTVDNGTNVMVKHYASGEYETSVDTVLTVGGVSDTFTSTTGIFVDQAPVVMIMGQTTTYSQTVYLGEGSPYVDAMVSDDVGIVSCKWEDSDGTVITEATLDPVETYLPYGVCELNLSPFTEVGEYIYTLTATDTLNQSNSNELNITVLPNSTPTADIGGNRSISAGTTLNITAIANDADGDDMNHQWMYGVKDSGSMYGAGSNLEFAHQFNDEGVYVVTFRVADTHNASVTEEIEVTVTEAIPDNNPPVIHLDENYYEIATRNGATPLSITIDATDSDGDDMTYSVQYYRDGMEIYPTYTDLSGNVMTISPEVNSSEELNAIIKVEDEHGLFATKSIDIHLKDQLPEIEFNVEITDTGFGSQTANPSSGLIGVVMYELEFDQCETEISLVELNATAIAFKNPYTNEIAFSNTYTEQGDNSLLFTNGMQVKYIGEVTDLTAINTLAGKEVFTAGTTGIVAYESVYAGQDDEGNPEFERFMWLNEAGRTAFETFTTENACGGGKGK